MSSSASITKSTIPADERRYDAIARRITDMIDAGALRPGDRVPSVRHTAKQHGAAIGTVLHAYRTLESVGRIAARPQSGYYVCDIARPMPEPAVSAPSPTPGLPTVGDLAVKIMKDTARPGMIQLGSAVPSPDVLPTRHLSRLSAAIGRRTGRGYDQYGSPAGCIELQVQLSKRYVEAGCSLSPDDWIVTCGAQEALALCLRAVATADGIVAIDSPAYFGQLQIIEMLGMKAVEIPTDPRQGIDIDALGRILGSTKVAAVLLSTNVHNPLGFVMAEARKRQLMTLLDQHDVPLIEDDAYGDLAFDVDRPDVCKAYDTAGRVLLCGSFSKTLTPGARVGFCAPGRYKNQVLRGKVNSTITTATLPQLAIAEFLAGGGYSRHLRKVRTTYQQRVRQVADAVQRYFPAGTCATRPAGGHVLWVELPQQIDSIGLFERAVEQNISIAPGPVFTASSDSYRNCLRLNCSYPMDAKLEQAIATLGRLARESM